MCACGCWVAAGRQGNAWAGKGHAILVQGSSTAVVSTKQCSARTAREHRTNAQKNKRNGAVLRADCAMPLLSGRDALDSASHGSSSRTPYKIYSVHGQPGPRLVARDTTYHTCYILLYVTTTVRTVSACSTSACSASCSLSATAQRGQLE